MYAYDLRRAWASPITGISLGDGVHPVLLYYCAVHYYCTTVLQTTVQSAVY